MAKQKTVYICQNCGTHSIKWIGKCSACGEWNTYVEEVVSKSSNNSNKIKIKKANDIKPLYLQEITEHPENRKTTNDTEFDRVLGGGVVAGSLVLIGGEPGIGKSTLLLQMALTMNNTTILYVSGEESAQQIKMRAQRIKYNSEKLLVLTENSTDQIFEHIENITPNMVIIDSIQTLYSNVIESAAGSISQIKQCAAEFMKFAKETATVVFLVGHINKEGSIAGPKVLEHIVDTVLQFEGDKNHAYRILRTVKNRFGSTSELGIYEMLSNGLRPVKNPSEILITPREEITSGVAISTTLEGSRPLLMEIQALVTPAAYGTPQRSTTGFDGRRLNMLLAVLEKRSKLRLGQQDVFLNIAGGMKITETGTDLAACMAIVSSFKDFPIPNSVCFAAEVGLGGEIRTVNRIENRISEAEKLGFDKIVVAKYGIKEASLPNSF